ncbi:AAA-domain-containing protein [Rhizophagus irregularis DAOM 181602=DAOM 197198]|nr:AAA-domain-containing protein [Rhizophagus irregularis DAOM 181602=DAOM 197198]
MSSSSSNYTARIAKIQIYDDLHSSSNDLKIGLSEKLWDELIKETVEDESEAIRATLKPYICVSVTPLDLYLKNPLRTTKHKPLISSIFTYARLQYPDRFEDTPEEHVCYVSKDFVKQNNLRDAIEVEIKIADPIELEEVIVGALNNESYESLIKDPSAVSAYFYSSPPVVVRQSQIYSFQQVSIPVSSNKFKVLMCNPVLQGIISTNTNFIITNLSQETLIYDNEEGEKNINNHDIADFYFEDYLDEPNILNSKDYYMETQLALLEVNGQDTGNGSESDWTTSASSISSDEDCLNNVASISRKSTFTPQILSSPFPVTLIQPIPKEREDPESRVLISLKDLAKLGIQSGSWALVSGPINEKTRLCKVYAIDISLSTIEVPYPPAYISPLLYFNLGFSDTNKLSSEQLFVQPAIRMQSLPPVAKYLVVARIAFPNCTDRFIYNASMDGLESWFEEADRIVCEGDIFSIPIDEEAARLRPQKVEGDVETLEDIKVATAPLNPTTAVYFKISKLKPQNKKKIMMYGYGRLVDTKLTRIEQIGMVHSRVPAVKQYYGISSEIPKLPNSNSILTSPGTSYAKLYDLISSCLHPNAATLKLSCTVLLHGPRGCGKKTTVYWVAESVGVHVFEVNCFDFAGETDAKTETSLRMRLDKAVTCSPCVFLLGHVDALAKKSAVLETGQEPTISTILQDCFKQLITNFQNIGYPVLVVGTTGDIDKIPASVIGCFRHEIAFEAPSEPARLAILERLTSDTPLAPDVSLSSLATQTAALVPKDLVDLVARAGLASLERVEISLKKTNQSVKDVDIVQAGITLTAADFEKALNKARASYSDSIGAPKIPNVTWDDVGGLADVKNDILDTIQLPLEHPELFAIGMKKRSGILLYGPPGTGKTLLAKAVATSCSLNFFSVKGPELLNMYIGESEANVRRVFQRARDAKPCVIFFDELDSVAPKRGEKGDSGGVMDRIVSQLLAELDGMGQGGGTADVFVIGATNRPDLLDPALLRPGRFDKLLYLGVSQDHESQLKIIQALTRKFRLHPSLDLGVVAKKCPFNYTGADFYALCSDAMLKAMSRTAEAIETKVAEINANPSSKFPKPINSQYYLNHLATPEDTLVEVNQNDFDRALAESK